MPSDPPLELEELQQFQHGPAAANDVPLCKGEIGNANVLCCQGNYCVAKIGDKVIFDDGKVGEIIDGGRENVFINGKPAATETSVAEGSEHREALERANAYTKNATGNVAKSLVEEALKKYEETQQMRNLSHRSPTMPQSTVRRRMDALRWGRRAFSTVSRGLGVPKVIEEARKTSDALQRGEYGQAAVGYLWTCVAVADVILPVSRARRIVTIIGAGKQANEGIDIARELLDSESETQSESQAMENATHDALEIRKRCPPPFVDEDGVLNMFICGSGNGP